MADDYSLAVAVTADLSQFRQQLRAELATVRQQGATIPVGATAGAAGTTVVPPGGASVASPGAAQTAAAVATQGAQAAASAAARAGLPASAISPGAQFLGTGGMVGPPGAMLPNAGGGWPAGWQAWGQPAGAPQPGGGPQPAPGNPVQPPPPPPQPGPSPGPGQGQRYWRGRAFLTGAYIANAAGRLVDASNQYNTALALSRGDPGALAMADVQHRHDIADAFPIAGRLALSLSEAGSGDETYIKRTLQDAQDQNALTQQMRERGEMAQDFRHQGEIAGLRGAAQARRIADYHYESQVYGVRNAQRQASEDTAAEAQKAKQRVDKEYNDRLGVQELQYKTKPNADIWKDAQYRAIEQAATDASEKQKALFGPMLSSADAVKQGAYRDISRAVRADDLRNLGSARASLFRAAGRPFEASISERFTQLGAELLTSDDNKLSILAKGGAGMLEQFGGLLRATGHQRRQLEAEGRIIQKQIDRDPLAARIERIRDDTESAVHAFDDLPDVFRRPLQSITRRVGGRREQFERQEDDDARQLRMQALNNRKEHYDLLAQNKQYTTQATDIRHETEEDVTAMRQSKKFSVDEIKRRIAEGISQEQSFEAQLRRRQGAEVGVNVREYAPGPGGGGANSMEPVVKGLESVRLAIEGLVSLFRGS